MKSTGMTDGAHKLVLLAWKYHFNDTISEYMNSPLTHNVLLKYCNVLLYFIFEKNFLPKAQLGSGCFTFTSAASHRRSGELILLRFSSDSLKCLQQKADEINGGRIFLESNCFDLSAP